MSLFYPVKDLSNNFIAKQNVWRGKRVSNEPTGLTVSQMSTIAIENANGHLNIWSRAAAKKFTQGQLL